MKSVIANLKKYFPEITNEDILNYISREDKSFGGFNDNNYPLSCFQYGDLTAKLDFHEGTMLVGEKEKIIVKNVSINSLLTSLIINKVELDVNGVYLTCSQVSQFANKLTLSNFNSKRKINWALDNVMIVSVSTHKYASFNPDNGFHAITIKDSQVSDTSLLSIPSQITSSKITIKDSSVARTNIDYGTEIVKSKIVDSEFKTTTVFGSTIQNVVFHNSVINGENISAMSQIGIKGDFNILSTGAGTIIFCDHAVYAISNNDFVQSYSLDEFKSKFLSF